MKKVLKKPLDLHIDNGVKIKFSSTSLSCIGASQLRTCSTVAYDGIVRKVLPFPTTYQCSPVVTGGFGGLISPKQTSKPSKLKYETI